jgi:flagella basal body P-ring formation protein FlgA
MNEPASKIRRGPRNDARAAVTLLLAVLSLGAASIATAAIQPLESIRSAAEGFVRSQMPPGQSGIVVSAGRLDPRLRLARCAAPLDTSFLSGEKMQAQVSVAVGCRAGADWTIYVPVTVQSRIRVWALRAPHAQGARLGAADVVAETRMVGGLAVGYVTDLSQLAHSTLRQPLPAGAVLTAAELLPDFMVRQGEQVTLIASADGVTVRAPGLALQDGRLGALVRVQNASSDKVVQGFVASDRVVNVTP